MWEIMYQVISVVNGSWNHVGFFRVERNAYKYADLVAAEMENAGIDGEVFVNEIKRDLP